MLSSQRSVKHVLEPKVIHRNRSDTYVGLNPALPLPMHTYASVEPYLFSNSA